MLGSGVFVFLTQVLLHLHLATWLANWASIGVLAVLYLGLSVSRRLRRTIGQGIDSKQILVGTSLSMLVFSLRQPWALPYAITLCAAVFVLLSRSAHLKVRYATIPAIAIAFVITINGRPDNWWQFHQRSDAGFFESLSWSTSQWGISEHPGLVGGSISAYHWLSYAFLGGLSHVSLLAPWEALMKLGLPLLHVIAAMMVLRSPFQLAREANTRQQEWKNIAAATFVLVSLNWFRFDSAGYGFVAGVSFLSIFISFRSHAKSALGGALLLSLATAIAMFSKANTAALVSGVMILVLAINFCRRKPISLIPAAVFVATAAAIYVVFFFGAASSASFFSLRGLPVIEALAQSLVGTPYAGPVGLIVTSTLILGSRLPLSSEVKEIRLAVFVLIFVFLMTGLLPLFYLNYAELMMPTHLLLLVFGCWFLTSLVFESQDLPNLLSIRSGVGFLSIGVSAGLIFPIAVNRLDRLTGLRGFLGETAWELLSKSSPYLLLILLVIVLSRIQRSVPIQTVLSLALVVCVGLLAGFQLDRGRRAMTWGHEIYSSDALNQSAFPSQHLTLVGTWIRENTQPETVLASNDFCCFGSKWWSSILENPQLHANDADIEWWKPLVATDWGRQKIMGDADRAFFTKSLSGVKWGGKNYLVAAESRRRLLIQGLTFQTGSGGLPTEDQLHRMSLSLAFANEPTAGALEELKSYGVSGYVVNLELTNLRNWSTYAFERFRSGNYLYLEFK